LPAPRARRGYVPISMLLNDLGLLVVDRDASGRVLGSDGSVSLTVCPGMSTVLVDGRGVPVRGTIIADDGGILIPEGALQGIRKAVLTARLGGVRKVMIDAGHGGKDTGAIGCGGLYEKTVALAVSLRLAKILERRGLEVSLTRKADVFIPLDDRVRICNREKPDLFISIHANAARSREVKGIETFYVRESIDDLTRARRRVRNGGKEIEGVDLKRGDRNLGLALYHTMFDMSRRRSREIGTRVNDSLWRSLDSPDRGVKEAGFRVLKGAECPALLVEVGFLSNRETERKFRQSEYLDRIAEAVAAGI
jgi:N-acetylmuramoyl-L-alanine amidase